MKVKAVEVDESCKYVTVGKVYECHGHLPQIGVVFLIGDRGYEVVAKISDEKDAHGVKWEIVE